MDIYLPVWWRLSRSHQVLWNDDCLATSSEPNIELHTSPFEWISCPWQELVSAQNHQYFFVRQPWSEISVHIEWSRSDASWDKMRPIFSSYNSAWLSCAFLIDLWWLRKIPLILMIPTKKPRGSGFAPWGLEKKERVVGSTWCSFLWQPTRQSLKEPGAFLLKKVTLLPGKVSKIKAGIWNSNEEQTSN